MTSEGTKTLIFTFTSKTGRSVSHNRHRIFFWIFLSEKGYIKAFYRLILSDFRGTRDKTKQIETNALIFSFAQPAPVLCNA